MHKIITACGLSFSAVFGSFCANAQDAVPVVNNTNSYAPEYFTPFQPTTAIDMVARIPGFILQGGDTGERGFGQANLNILINGRRPSSKSSDASEILGRIPADKVKRINIVDGASLDIPGLSGQVADIITAGGSLSGNWEYAARWARDTEPQLLEGEISVSGSSGDLAYVASFRAGQFTFSENGPETFADGFGTVFEDRTEDIGFAGNRPQLDLNLTWTPNNGHIANLNLAGELFNQRFSNNETFQALTPRGNTGQSRFDNGEDEYNYEIGGDYTLPFGIGKLKLIGLHRFENSEFTDVFQNFTTGQLPFVSRFDRDAEEGETIARAEYSWARGNQHDWQLSAEGAFNVLDDTSGFTNNNTSPNSTTVRVEERRAEGNLTHSWAVSDRLNIQTSLGGEYSRLAVVSGTDPAREFVRPKGFISASYKQSDHYTWRSKIERGVGQLDFGTFISAVNLTENFVSSGNAQIVPTQFWNAEVELERKDPKTLSGTVKAFVRFIEDPIDRIRFNDGTEGPGNLDDALLYGIEANATLLLDSIGWDGARLELEGALRDSQIDDPITTLTRRINNTNIWDYEIELRRDIPNTPYAWSLELDQNRQSPFFRLDQSFDVHLDRPSMQFTVSHKDFLGMRLDLTLQNILKFNIERPRIIFDGDRNGNILEIQNFSRSRGRRISLVISDTF